jgi:hypothetical protein
MTLPPLTDLVVSPDGLGALTIGNPVPVDGVGSLLVEWEPNYCEGLGGAVEGGPYAGAWQSAYPLAVSAAVGEREPFGVITGDGLREGAVSAINVWSPELTTAEGIHAGSTTDELRAAYPSFDEVNQGQASTVYAINGANSRLLFEVGETDPAGGLADYWGDQSNTVLWMRVVPSTAPAGGTAGGDGGGPCII